MEIRKLKPGKEYLNLAQVKRVRPVIGHAVGSVGRFELWRKGDVSKD